ncbi:Cof-type HAD-IIB family hydrolase [uncultured Nocardioides sp.]|uniref:Cof-type HAD-IIB family hydrolase n=1 Tax=uncultured Nocardioides sp. TaxID=198441 RepID=UPI00262399C7|nr:Cof-type HAD-IIB family hydrolase [uncultured Nocardioides sp.]
MTTHSTDLPSPADVRLVVTDMDGTLLGADGAVPAAFWPLVDEMRERGVVFAPASGRQYATLHRTFSSVADGMVVIAENGAYVVRDGDELSSVTLDPALAADVVRHLRELADGPDGLDLGVVWCGRTTAYVERTDRAFLDHVDPYYASLTPVDDLLATGEVPVKIAVFTPDDPRTTTAPALAPYDASQGGSLQVVVSGARWVDVMPTGVDKGVAVRRLQESLGIGPEHTVVFGDNFNDVEMLDAAELSFAMEGSPDGVLERARYRAPSHTDEGVVTVLRHLLDGLDELDGTQPRAV